MKRVGVGDEGSSKFITAQVSSLDDHKLKEFGQPHSKQLDVEEQVVLGVNMVLKDVEHLNDGLASRDHNVVHPNGLNYVECLCSEK